jgi:hypothetical protein
MDVFRNENATARSSRDTQQQEKCSSKADPYGMTTKRKMFGED